MKKTRLVDRFCRILFALNLLYLTPMSWGQNEILSEASSEQQSLEFSLQTSQGIARFALYVPVKEMTQAKRVQDILTKHAPPIFSYFGYAPKEVVHVRLNFSAKRANGSATVFPRDMIVLNMFPPFGSSHLLTSDDWLKGLILHELVHIVHLERTEGFLDVLTSIFGSIGRIAGVTPRWFTEGVAVWAETHFTGGGRLRHAGMMAQARYFLSKPGFCHSIDCLDAPGEYPYGNYSYWIGGMFMDYLEQQKPGTIACIIKNNSYSFPFFLRSPFESCTGLTDTMEGLFQKFRASVLRKEKTTDRFKNRLHVIDAHQIGQPMFERSYEVLGQDVYWVEQDFDRTRLVRFDLQRKKRTAEKKNFHIDQLLRVGDELVMSTSDFQRLWRQRELKTLPDDKTFGSGDYVMNTREGLHIWKFHYNQWRLYRKGSEQEEVDRLNQFANLVDVKGEYFLTQDDQGYKVFHHGDLRPKRVSQMASRLQTSCGPNLILKEADSLVLIRSNNEYVLQEQWTKDLISLRAGQQQTVFRFASSPENLYSWGRGCKSLSKYIVKKGERRGLPMFASRKVEKPVEEVVAEIKTYPQLKHFKPNWWFFSYIAGDVISQLTLMTSINDPLDRHRLNLNLTFFDEINKIHPTGTYTYNWSGTDIGVGVTQSYIDNVARSQPDDNSSYFAFVGRSFFWGNLSYRLELQGSYFEESDIISTRQGKEPILINQLMWAPLFRDDFFQRLGLISVTRYLDVDNGKSYARQELRVRGRLQPFTRFYTDFQASYGKLFKDNFRDGILYSGGVNDYDTNTLHEFMGLGPNSSFGNEVATGRLQLNYELWRVQRGYGLSPFFLRTLNGIAGSDYLKTDFIYGPDRFAFKSFAQSYYAGLRANITLGYFVPLQLDVFQIRVNRDLGHDTNESRFFLRGNLPF